MDALPICSLPAAPSWMGRLTTLRAVCYGDHPFAIRVDSREFEF